MIKSFKYIILTLSLFIRCECKDKNQEQELSIKEQLKNHTQQELDENAKLSQEVLKVVNELRTKSSSFKTYLINLRDKFINNPGDFGPNSYKENRIDNVSIQTHEGITVVKEAIKFFDEMPSPLQPLKYNIILDKSSLLMAKYMNKYSFFDHINNSIPEYSEPSKRIDQYCKRKRYCSENLWCGNLSKNMSLHDKAVKMVVDLFVDDNVPNRGHRKALVSPEATDLGNGLWTYEKGQYKGNDVFVMNFGAGIEE